MSALRRWIDRLLTAKAASRPMWREEPPMRIQCAWCGKVLREGVGPTSHGICPSCSDAFEADAEPKACAA